MAGYNSKRLMAMDKMATNLPSIQIEGLNKKQRLLADLIWSFDSKEQVTAFIRTLPPKDRRDAQTITEMMILAFMDEVDSIEQSTIDIINQLKDAQ